MITYPHIPLSAQDPVHTFLSLYVMGPDLEITSKSSLCKSVMLESAEVHSHVVEFHLTYVGTIRVYFPNAQRARRGGAILLRCPLGT